MAKGGTNGDGALRLPKSPFLLQRLDDRDIYAVVGEEGFERLTNAFYQQVPHYDILGPMYPPDDLAGAKERLRDFLCQEAHAQA